MNPPTPELIPTACGPTLARIQSVLDGATLPDKIAADPHLTACESCRGRARATRTLLAALPALDEPDTLPIGLTGAILAEVKSDRRARIRRRAVALVGSLAAAVAIVVWAATRSAGRPSPDSSPEIVSPRPDHIPALASTSAPTPGSRPIRIGDELARAGGAIRESSRELTDPAGAASQVFATLPSSFFLKPTPPPTPTEPVARSLAEISEVAKTGLEPVTGSAQKAFARFLRDVEAMQPGKPKS